MPVNTTSLTKDECKFTKTKMDLERMLVDQGVFP
ncbi:hypothetical protein L917_15538 [Phytophthora nicotianae]|uniref:Uncharacterized protein n=1 Tax=Phytophthora nicotianae TaxID=4792 RepID=W2G791_PHYNI|nr:hypothetical protein L915_15836 [Phytophthora nicotianae]ETL31490.1 hypothetical protein L916_15735 [Phytophthora nicotianae]ETL84741.1 hypothetical protein L917_15538 [Phytophthora nicotianae]ETM37896.1 hypothetical protein L914_15678 [Phytophthora nicotianae]